MTTITTAALREFVAARQEAGASNAEINRELAVLRRAFNLAIQAGRLLAKPHVPMLKEQNTRTGVHLRRRKAARRGRKGRLVHQWRTGGPRSDRSNHPVLHRHRNGGCGVDDLTPVTHDYKVYDNAFTGNIRRIVIGVGPVGKAFDSTPRMERRWLRARSCWKRRTTPAILSEGRERDQNGIRTGTVGLLECVDAVALNGDRLNSLMISRGSGEPGRNRTFNQQIKSYFSRPPTGAASPGHVVGSASRRVEPQRSQ